MNIVFDIGGTNMRVATAENGELGEIRKVPTPQDPMEGIAMLVQIAKELSQGMVEKIAGDVPGSIDCEGRLDAKNLPLWEGVKFAEEVSRALGVSAQVFNDAALIGYGEARGGAGKDFARVVYMTVSTGFGGALVTDDLASSPLLGSEFPELKPSI